MAFPIDHLMTVVTDRAAAAAALQRMGFALTPAGEHPGRGTSNHLMFFGPLYWELLSIDAPTEANRPQRALLEAGPGLLGCALATADLEADLGRLDALGCGHTDPVEITRPVMVDGVLQTARFRLSNLRPSDALGAYLFFCQQLTPEFVWPSPPQQHPNGARRLRYVYVADDEAGRSPLAQLLGGADGPEIVTLTAAERRAYFPRSPVYEGLAPRLIGVGLEVADLDACRRLLLANGVAVTARSEHLYVCDPALGEQPILFSGPAA